jgi:cytochrome P450
MTYDELRQLPVMDAVIRETLRVHPPIHSIMRGVRSPVAVPPSLASHPNKKGDGTMVVPEGHYVLACPAVSQVDPLVWKDPLKWIPTRWQDVDGMAAQAYKQYADENGEKVDYGFGAISKGTESPYQPFGAGRHRCIGEQVGVFIASRHREIVSFVHAVCLFTAWDHSRNHHTSCGIEAGAACAGPQLPRKVLPHTTILNVLKAL